MKLNSVPPKEGYTWIRQGIWLFKQNPLGFLMLVFMYVFVAQLAVLVPVIGIFAVLLLTPTLSVGFMTACRQAIQKERIRPSVYVVALQSSPLIRKRILQLGLVYAALILALSYGGRTEIVEAVRDIAAKAKQGRLEPEEMPSRIGVSMKLGIKLIERLRSTVGEGSVFEVRLADAATPPARCCAVASWSARSAQSATTASPARDAAGATHVTHVTHRPPPRTDGLATGFPSLDRELPDGGWPRGALTELLCDHTGIGELALMLPALARLTAALKQHKPETVVHFAAVAYIAESIAKPDAYYRINVEGTLSLLRAMQDAGVKRIVFSSSCATYGVVSDIITEETPQAPINPYGRSKMMAEQVIRDVGRVAGIESVILRYFNAAGSDPELEIGERHDPEPHVIPLAIRGAIDGGFVFTINGDDFPTPDGTCVRDYVHVCDLAEAHLKHEEDVMMPLVARLPQPRAPLFAQWCV